jgi:hypothetical protein
MGLGARGYRRTVTWTERKHLTFWPPGALANLGAR